jgi:hypothetical protein
MRLFKSATGHPGDNARQRFMPTDFFVFDLDRVRLFDSPNASCDWPNSGKWIGL